MDFERCLSARLTDKSIKLIKSWKLRSRKCSDGRRALATFITSYQRGIKLLSWLKLVALIHSGRVELQWMRTLSAGGARPPGGQQRSHSVIFERVQTVGTLVRG